MKGSLEVGGAAQVFVWGGRWRGDIADGRMKDQVADGAIGEELVLERAGAGVFEARGGEVLGQAQDAEAATVGVGASWKLTHLPVEN
jgi:hypothetical protein